MDELGHQRFAVVGHDTGVVISYALAADYPDRVDRAGRRRDPRPSDGRPLAAAVRAGAGQQQALAHPVQPRRGEIAEQLVAGREKIFYGYEFAIQGGHLPEESSTTTSAWSPSPAPCPAASRSTGRGTPPWRRTATVRPRR